MTWTAGPDALAIAATGQEAARHGQWGMCHRGREGQPRSLNRWLRCAIVGGGAETPAGGDEPKSPRDAASGRLADDAVPGLRLIYLPMVRTHREQAMPLTDISPHPVHRLRSLWSQQAPRSVTLVLARILTATVLGFPAISPAMADVIVTFNDPTNAVDKTVTFVIESKGAPPRTIDVTIKPDAHGAGKREAIKEALSKTFTVERVTLDGAPGINFTNLLARVPHPVSWTQYCC